MSSSAWGPKKSLPTSPTSIPGTQMPSLIVQPPEPPKPPEPVTFPTLFELADEQLRQPSSTGSRVDGLFHELLRSNPEELYQDSLDNPDKYREDLRTLLSELVTTRRQPSFEERKKLDAAVLDFMAAPRKEPPKKPPVPPSPTKLMEFKTPDFVSRGDEEEPGPALGSGGNPRPFWWL